VVKRLGRIISALRAADAVRDARAAGFENLSFDLMFWLPGQSLTSWRTTIERAVDLSPDHLSLYLLELYPNAPLREVMAREPQTSSQAPDDDAAEMYLQALARLDDAGYAQYEISNVARPGRWSRHNVKYWQGGDWRGFGCGAHSTVDGVRWKNLASTSEYIDRLQAGQSPAIEREPLGPQARLEEALFTGLRLVEGIDARNFRTRFGVDPWSRYGDRLSAFADGGFLWRRGEVFGLTREGMLVANEILQVFV
jgi:oxygen-independent coproporphyrinogen-3 oxidase